MEINESQILTHVKRIFVKLSKEEIEEIKKLQGEDYDLQVKWIGNEIKFVEYPEFSARNGYTELNEGHQISVILTKKVAS